MAKNGGRCPNEEYSFFCTSKHKNKGRCVREAEDCDQNLEGLRSKYYDKPLPYRKNSRLVLPETNRNVSLKLPRGRAIEDIVFPESCIAPWQFDRKLLSRPKFGKTASAYRVYREDDDGEREEGVLRLRRLERDSKITEHWENYQNIQEDFKSVVMRLLFTGRCRNMAVEIYEVGDETFERWCLSSKRTVEEIKQAIATIVHKLNKLNDGGILHQDAHGNNVLCLGSDINSPVKWRVIDFDEVKFMDLKKNNFDSKIFLSFAILILQEKLKKSKNLADFVANHWYNCRFDVNFFKKVHEVPNYYLKYIQDAERIIARK
jgi:hypothetical protein